VQLDASDATSRRIMPSPKESTIRRELFNTALLQAFPDLSSVRKLN